MKSIRRFLTGWLLLGIGVAVLGSAWVILTVARKGLTREFTRALAGKAVALGSLLEEDEDGLEFEFSEMAMPEYSRAQSPEYFQIWIDGRTFRRSASLAGADLALPAEHGGGPVTWDLELPDGRPGRALALPLVSRMELDDDDEESTEAAVDDLAGPTALVVVARSRAPLDEALSQLRLGIAIAIAACCLVIVLVVALTVRRGLAPLTRLADHLEDLGPAGLSERLPVASQAREVAPVTTRLNELFDRLDAAFQRERRMTANMAHELRTPLAEILSAADVARRWPEDDELQDEAVTTAHEVSTRMSQVVDALLRLSRIEGGQEEPVRESVSLRELLRETGETFVTRLAEAELAYDAEEMNEIAVRSDRGLLSVIARNLIDNAVAHSERGGRIFSRLSERDREAEWTLENGPVSLTPEDLEHVVEPLWTNESARSRREHSGLGLALVRAAADALGIEVRFALRDRVFVTSVTLPGAVLSEPGASSESVDRGAAERSRSSSGNQAHLESR